MVFALGIRRLVVGVGRCEGRSVEFIAHGLLLACS
jgi:hypothetical protein